MTGDRLHRHHASDPDRKPHRGRYARFRPGDVVLEPPHLIVTMYRHTMLGGSCHILVTTGTGYGTALVTSLEYRRLLG